MEYQWSSAIGIFIKQVWGLNDLLFFRNYFTLAPRARASVLINTKYSTRTVFYYLGLLPTLGMKVPTLGMYFP